MNIFTKILILASLLYCTSTFAQAPRSMYDGAKRIYYTDMVDAKNKLIEYHKERHLKEYKDKDYEGIDSSLFPFEMLKDLVLHDERTLNFDFSFPEITEFKSDDNKVKLYSWDNYKGGAVNRIYDGITTYIYDKDYYAYATVWNEFEELADEQNGNIVTDRIENFQTITSALGKIIYLVFGSERWEGFSMEYVKAYSLFEGYLIPESIFNINNQRQYILSNEFQPNLGSTNKKYMEYENETIFVPQLWIPEKFEVNIASGLVDVYKYDGYYFNLNKTIFSSEEPLYNALENFQYNICDIKLSPYTIRIDKMPNDTYRYSSWKNKRTIEVPDIIINNGLLIESISGEKGRGSVKEKFVFENNGYFYIVSFERIIYNRFVSIEDAKLIVKRNDKIIMELIAQ